MYPWGAERYRYLSHGVMNVGLSEGDRVVAVPCIKYGLRMHGNGAGLVEGRLRMVSLPGGMPIELLEVDSPPEGPVDHSVAPSVRGPQGDLLEDSQADIPHGPFDQGMVWSLPIWLLFIFANTSERCMMLLTLGSTNHTHLSILCTQTYLRCSTPFKVAGQGPVSIL